MTDPTINPSPQTAGRIERLAVVICSLALALGALAWSWQHHALLNYGDAVAHLHIARRIFDARLVRLSMLGSVWLPLPHLLMLPFALKYSWWANGLAAVPASMLAYIFSCLGFYRLTRRWLPIDASVVALCLFALNPNLLYLQTTAMTEPLFLCLLVWTTLWMVQWRDAIDVDAAQAKRLQIAIAFALVAAVYTRYDGWIVCAIAWTTIGVALMRRRRLASFSFWLASFFVVAAPLAWFAYNQICFGDWLEFMRGPYSAKAIELRTAIPGSGPPHPGWHNMATSLVFFVKAAQMDALTTLGGNLIGNLFLATGLISTALIGLIRRNAGVRWLLLLWIPLPFYAYSVAYGSVPIFLPVWWPHSWYNTRYGMELLPALCIGAGFTAHLVLRLADDFKPRLGRVVCALLVAVAVSNALLLLRGQPLTYVEGIKNIHARRPLEEQIPPAIVAALQAKPNAVILMDTSTYPNLVAFAGIPLRQTINESDLWIFEQALDAPAKHADLVLAFHGDAIDQAITRHPEHLQAIGHFYAPGQPAATLYRSTP